MFPVLFVLSLLNLWDFNKPQERHFYWTPQELHIKNKITTKQDILKMKNQSEICRVLIFMVQISWEVCICSEKCSCALKQKSATDSCSAHDWQNVRGSHAFSHVWSWCKYLILQPLNSPNTLMVYVESSSWMDPCGIAYFCAIDISSETWEMLTASFAGLPGWPY